jgi:hypothetical protein
MVGWSDAGKRAIAEAMFRRGRTFLRAAALLQREGGYSFVVGHLICQALEIMLKAFLLISDFNKYEPKLKRFGHDLLALSEEVSAAYGLKPMREPLQQELHELNNLYKTNFLRYGDFRDLLLDPNIFIKDTRVMRRMLAAVRLADRALK